MKDLMLFPFFLFKERQTNPTTFRNPILILSLPLKETRFVRSGQAGSEKDAMSRAAQECRRSLKE